MDYAECLLHSCPGHSYPSVCRLQERKLLTQVQKTWVRISRLVLATRDLSIYLQAVLHLAMWVMLLLSGPCMFLAAICNALNLPNKNARPPYLQTTFKAHARVGTLFTRGDIIHGGTLFTPTPGSTIQGQEAEIHVEHSLLGQCSCP